MGTRADFYVGRGEQAEWLGSIAWDGYPDGIAPGGETKSVPWPKGESLFESVTEAQYRERLEQFFADCGDVTRPAQGWPWPWKDSRTTDYAYAFEAGKVYASRFGRAWVDPQVARKDDDEELPKTAVFPDMTARQNVTLGGRSGLIVLGS